MSALQKGKKKVEEIAAKAKDAVTNGHGEEHTDTPAEDAQAVDVDTGAQEESAQAATPVQEPDSSVAELQTPHFAGEATVR